MNTRTLLATTAALWSFLAPVVHAQQMPQDNWRFDNLQFSAPGNPTLGSIAIGSGGVFVEQATNPVSIAQFEESGVFVRQFGSFTDIVGIACDSAGNVYAVNAGDRKVKVYSSTGTFLREWGGTGTTDGLFGNLTSGYAYVNLITVDRNDQVYVCDPGNRRVQVFDTNGNFLRKWGDPGSLPGQFGVNTPYHIAASPNGWIYVGGNSGIVVFDAQGNYLKHSSGFYTAASSFDGFATTQDGLVAGFNYGGGNWFLEAKDSSLTSVVGTYTYPPVTLSSTNTPVALAFNARGDAFVTISSTVKVYEREYQGVQNSLLPPALPQPIVLSSAQRDGTAWLDVDYKVTDVDSAMVSTAAAAFINGGNLLASIVPMKTFREGTAANIGSGIPTGVTKRITWDMAADWSVDYAQIQVEMLAKDNRNPLGIHWITLPAENGNPALQVSKAPITDDQLRSLWFWFIASGHSKVSKANGSDTLYGANSGYAGLVLAKDNSNGASINPTNSGLAFAYQELGIRGITLAEIARAQAGSYGFSSVTNRSVVREVGTLTKVLAGWGNSAYAEVPAAVQMAGVTKFAVKGGNGAAVKSDGTVLTWNNGILNTSPNLTGVASVGAGSSHYVALKSDGTLWAWGSNGSGQLGDGTTTDRTQPVQVGSATDWAFVACGGSSTLAIKSNGTLWAWGYGGNGVLGDSTSTNRSSPVQVGTATNWSSVSTSGSHTLGIRTDGTLWGWGNNGQGQVGDGSYNSRFSPVQIGAATNWSKVSAGGSHTVALRTNGTLWAWGNNSYGQIGDGTTTTSNAPIQIGTATNWSAVAAGDYHTVVLKTDGTVAAWGQNTSGETSVPAGLSGVTAIGAGTSSSFALRSNP
ncbi:MAG: hypothetical protein U1F81_24605 [Verrucomicrobiaceae bacterium]